MTRILFLLGALVMLAACAEGPYGYKSNPAHTTIYTPAGAVDYHCPPGQRKKGNC